MTGDARGLLVRLATAADAGSIRAIYAPVVEHSAVSFELTAPSEEEMAARIVDRLPAYPWLVAESQIGDGPAGYAYAGPFAARGAYRWSVETSVYVADTQRGRGVGVALYQSLINVLTAQGYARALAGIALPNPASVRLHQRLGFEPVGVYRAVGWKLGRWHDVGWWQRALTGDGAPPTPVPLDALPAEVLAGALRSA